MNRTLRLTTLAAAVAASLALAACDRQGDSTVGQSGADSTAPATQNNAGTQIREDARQLGQDMKAAGSDAADAMARGAADATITAKVNAALAADDALKAIKINVDTTNGHVRLSGTAPSTEARQRATTLASAVEGVVQVDNRLTVDGQG